MGSIGNRNKIDIEYSEHSIQKALRYNFLSPNSVKYFTENLSIYNWESDALKITKSNYSYEFEIKISRSDFKNDFKHKKNKHIILENKEDVNKPNYFYYVVPTDLIKVDEIPDYAGLIYVKGVVFGTNIRYYFTEIKKAPKLHKEKIDISGLNLVDKFYYNYIHWKHKHEKDLNEYKVMLNESKTFDGKQYKYTLPQATEMIDNYQEKLKEISFQSESWKNMYYHEQGLVRRLTRLCKDNNIDAQPLIDSYEKDYMKDKINVII
jgi:hypothetical protein